MDSPRSGFRRARAASWALVGVAVTGVTGASTLAYADTVKPPSTQVSVEPAVLQPNPPSAPEPEPAPIPVTTTTDPVIPEPTMVEQPSPTEQPSAPVDQYTPRHDAQQTQSAPTPASAEPRPSTPPTTKRRNLTPSTVMAPNYSPHVTISRGS
ncbi:hypothetical protein CIW52_14505 [Mycolicibacterium sp. P9-64]|uniref:hypothetical protein n=1 Tax=Mycolicibacterium sp. P9-64 TaxID=2024612 RepID=UPI0011EC730D|nr:hypothetical protein [Mycolicibacterium sp. P9-64]KAA0083748.1 hypothetical protein CIW52_14505 [Mycolicibacterium sp. P9-64]